MSDFIASKEMQAERERGGKKDEAGQRTRWPMKRALRMHSRYNCKMMSENLRIRSKDGSMKLDEHQTKSRGEAYSDDIVGEFGWQCCLDGRHSSPKPFIRTQARVDQRRRGLTSLQ